MAKFTPELKKVDYANIDLPSYEEYKEAVFLDVSTRGNVNVSLKLRQKYAYQHADMGDKIRAFEKAYDLPCGFPTVRTFGNATNYVEAFENLLNYCVEQGENTERGYANKCEKSKKCKVLGFTDAERIDADRIKAIVDTDIGQFKMTVIEANGEHNIYHTRVLFHKL